MSSPRILLDGALEPYRAGGRTALLADALSPGLWEDRTFVERWFKSALPFLRA